MPQRTRSLLRGVIAVLLGVSAALVGTTAASAAGCTTYYVSSATGSDSNDGCSSTTPWQSLANVNATTFAAGNQLLFAKGGSWSGELKLLGSGASGSPIVVSSYGSGAAPIIAGGGAAAAIALVNEQYVTIQNLEITNTTTSAAVRAGILAENDTSGILNGIHILNNNIHDVLGYWDKSTGQPSNDSGIGFNLSDSYTTNGWNDVDIDGNTLTKVDAGGIYIGSVAGTNHSIVTANVVIQNNTITNTGGNDVVCVYCNAPTVQNNVTTDSGYRYSGAGYWMALNNGGVWQNNEIARQWRALWDGEAFDIDHDNTNVTLQYNYTHDNPYGFMEFCCSTTFGSLGTSVIRDNISQNDGSTNAVFSTLNGVEAGASAQFYNNTVYMGPNDNGYVASGTPASSAAVSFTNNLIYHLGQGGYNAGNVSWSHNLMYGVHPSTEPADSSKITSDPKLADPGAAGSGRSSASVYQLLSGSPALGAGAVISSNGGEDYFGNPVSSTAAPNIGAYNGAAVSALASSSGGHWRFDEGTGTAASDSTGHLNNGTLQAGAGWTTGQLGSGALSLSGATNSWVDIPTTAIDTSASYTVSAWVQPSTVTGNQTFASIDGTTISPFYLQLSAGKLTLTERSSDSTASTATQVVGPAAVAGTWYQLVGVYDATAGTIKLYVNGVLQGTTAYTSGWKATGHTTIGRAKWNGGNVDFVNGAIDDVQLIPRAVTDREAFAIGTGATAYYAFDEGSGSSTTDASGDMPNASLEGNAGWAAGHIGTGALSQTGQSGAFAQTPGAAIDTRKSYAVAAWVNLNTTSGGNQTIVSQFGSNISPFYLQLTGGKFAFVVRSSDSTSSTATSVTATSAATAGTWYHLVGMWDSSSGTISLYVNGTLQGTAAYSTPWTGVLGTTVIGAGEWALSPVDFVNGSIDDVHLYNRTLTSAQITTLATP
ncbi:MULTISPECIES: LamG domain-containing protein [unclassified Leifsonia]|uniref:LamG domain-containing protein n=1 Tax=unclassified Leifsonia TaxID=2663824 RepID=UPI0008A74778|nr:MULTISPECIES: LamG domain-containing protein [unclassified Leifsonia]SEH55887.1 Concanavalin A-like lectin/glucanases superfamily protein [Leifsonia sp. CL154]SFL23141.1 Concanavalin A-like lectin/glucanases superfamily protein [Leifsonia sp. CL147]